MKLILVYRQRELGEAWRRRFSDQENVSVVEADICAVPCDAIVSPANSFGFMDGGLDYALSERFGWDLQERLQRIIEDKYYGELLVGQAEIVATNDADVPWLISAPTMRVPMHVKHTVNAYLAMRAILLAARAHAEPPPIRSVAIPGLGTGAGALDVGIAARQMWVAYDEFALGNRSPFDGFAEAQTHQLRLNPVARIYN